MDWQLVFNRVLSMPPHTNIIVHKPCLPPEGAIEAMGEPHGQLRDLEIPLSDGGRIHIVEFTNNYLVHWDRKSPSRDPIGHLREDASPLYDLFIDGVKWISRLVR